MDTMNISLPTPLRDFVNSQVAAGNYSSASEYIRGLIQQDHERRYREDVDRKLLESVESGPATPVTAEEWNGIRGDVRDRAARRGKG